MKVRTSLVTTYLSNFLHFSFFLYTINENKLIANFKKEGLEYANTISNSWHYYDVNIDQNND